jgi:hypothetical protein
MVETADRLRLSRARPRALVMNSSNVAPRTVSTLWSPRMKTESATPPAILKSSAPKRNRSFPISPSWKVLTAFTNRRPSCGRSSGQRGPFFHCPFKRWVGATTQQVSEWHNPAVRNLRARLPLTRTVQCRLFFSTNFMVSFLIAHAYALSCVAPRAVTSMRPLRMVHIYFPSIVDAGES